MEPRQIPETNTRPLLIEGERASELAPPPQPREPPRRPKTSQSTHVENTEPDHRPLNNGTPKDACALLPRTCESVTLHGKGTLQM